MTRTDCLYVAVFFIVSCGFALAEEEHLAGDVFSPLYARSAFAHGYIHGYQQGFHHGDLDLQLGRPPRDPSALASFKHPCANYLGSFGSKGLFKSGFQDGFLAGYADAIKGESFRAIASMRSAARDLVSRSGPSQFDRGFKDGYVSGRLQGAEDGRALISANPVQEPCLGKKADYCDAFTRGFQMGYSDGYENQSANGTSARNLRAKADK